MSEKYFLVPIRLKTRIMYCLYTKFNDWALYCYETYWKWLKEEDEEWKKR